MGAKSVMLCPLCKEAMIAIFLVGLIFQRLVVCDVLPCRSSRVPCLDQLATHQRKTLHTRPCTFHTTHGTVHIS